MMKESENTLDKKFQVLSNRTRREILMRLNQESHSAGEIATCFQITPASISYHLFYPNGIPAFESADKKSADRFDPASATGKAVGY